MPTLLHFFVFLSVLGLGYGFYLQRKLLKRDKWARPVQSLQHAGTSVGHLVYHYEEITIPSLKGIYFADLTSKIKQIIAESEIKSGQVCILSKHTTTSVTINEMEARLVDDSRQFLQKLAPSAYPYLHNDLHLREGPSDWNGGNEAWRAQEPINAHSHLLNLIIGSSVTVPVHDRELKLGRWQSIIMVELDGPRERMIGVHIVGQKI